MATNGDILLHHKIPGPNVCCPVHALVAWVLRLLHDGACPETLLCTFHDAPSLLVMATCSKQQYCCDHEESYPTVWKIQCQLQCKTNWCSFTMVVAWEVPWHYTSTNVMPSPFNALANGPSTPSSSISTASLMQALGALPNQCPWPLLFST